MKRFTRHLSLAVAACATAMGMSLALSAWAVTTINCYNYNGDGSCITNDLCAPGPLSTQVYYCKQLSVPYSDPGCCSYLRTDTNWVNNGGLCPRSGTTTTTITLASNNRDLICFGGSDTSTTQAPSNTDVIGHCGAPSAP